MSVVPSFDHYFGYEELTSILEQFALSQPNLVTLGSIGRSHEGRDIEVVTLTNSQTGPAAHKPAFWIDGNIHATEVSATSACIYFIEYMLRNYGTDGDVTRCLDTRVFYVVPRVNPDGAELFFSNPPKYIRSSTRPHPFDEEPTRGLIRQDIDADGRLLSMRVRDPLGTWKTHPEEPRLLIRRNADEEGGEYYRLLPEGLLENYDGVTITVPPAKEGLDLNRNFPGHWRPEADQVGAGPFPTSEPEVRACVEFIAGHPNITGGITFHTFSGVLLRPFGTQSDEQFPAEDLWAFQAIGAKGTELTGYPAISVYHDFRYHPKEVITGVFDDWLYDHLGIFGWTVEIWSPQRQAGITDYKYIDWFREHPIGDDLKLLQWSDHALDGKGYVDWYPFNHPQLGSIEIGGWDAIYAFRNPPPHLLEDELALFPRWLMYNALISPILKIHHVGVDKIGDQTYRLHASVDNAGWLPTNVTKHAAEKKIVRGVIAELTLSAGTKLISGQLRTDCGQLEGRSNKPASGFGWSSDPTDHRAKLEWLVTGSVGAEIEITFRHERAGRVSAQVTLPA